MAKAVPPLDLLIQATTPPDEIAHPLVLGRSDLDTVLKTLKIKRKGLIDRGDYGTGWTMLEDKMLKLLFDPDGIWHGIWYGLFPDELTWQVQDALTVEVGLRTVIGMDGVAREEPYPYSQITAGKVPIHLGGSDIRQFATLPQFIGTTHYATPRPGGPFPPHLQWTMSAREPDKWISLSTELPYGSVGAEFLLKAIKPEHYGRWVFDYCLYSLGLWSKAAAARSPREA